VVLRFPFLSIAALAWLLMAPSARADASRCLAAHEAAQQLMQEARLREARSELLVCVQRDCPRPVSADCQAFLAEVDTRTPSVVFAVSGSAGEDVIDVRIGEAGVLLAEHADGKALAMDPGAHTFRFEAPGYVPSALLVSVREAEKLRLVRAVLTALPPVASRADVGAKGVGAERIAAPPSPTRAPATPLRPRRLLRTSYALLGVAVSAAAVGIGFGVAGKHKLHALRAGCGKSGDCSEHALDVGRRRYVLADVGYGAAGALALGAALSYALGRRAARTMDLQVEVGRGAAGLTLHGRF
jgi:hypothetical protein